MMLKYYLWGCSSPRWAYAGPASNDRNDDRRMESRRHGGSPGHGQLFGVRRPLRYMSYHLDLDENQVSQLADILNQLKTERAQAGVDLERSVADIARAMDAENFNAEDVQAALKLRVDSAKRLRDEVLEALRKTHQMLDPEQRSRLAYMLRSGQLTI